MSRSERRAMIVRDHPALSDSRQCRLLSLGRSSLYYDAKGGERGDARADAADRRAVPEVPVLRRPSDGTSPAPRGRVDRPTPGRSADEPDGASGDLSGAAYQRSAPRAPGLPISAAGPGDRAGEPCLVRRYHLYPGAARLPLPGGDHGLGKPVTSWPGGCRTHWTQASARTRSTRPWPGMASRR